MYYTTLFYCFLGHIYYNITMSNIVIYHGSDKIIKNPTYHYEQSNKSNDYGLGFYCTRNLDMAKEWANRRTTNGYANKYSFDERGLKILDLTDKTKYNVLHWIAILIHNRNFLEDDLEEYKESFEYLSKYYVDVNKYDVVIGYRADDAYFTFPLMFIRNVLTYEKLEEIYLNGNLGKQYVLISKKAFQHIKYISSIEAESIYHDRFIVRRDKADNSYRALEREERKSKGKRLSDLIGDNHD